MSLTFIYHQQGKDSMYNLWHELGNRVMFLYVDNSDGNIVTFENIYPLKRGGLYFIGAKKIHYTVPETPDKYVRDKLFIESSRFEKILEVCDSRNRLNRVFANNKLVCAQIPKDEQQIIDNLFSQVQRCQDNAVYYETMLVSLCARLVMYLDKYQARALPVSDSKNFVFQAIEYINKHIAESLTIEEISNAVFISKYYFCRSFKSVTGLSVMEYILSTRLSLAQELLLEKKMTVSQISNQCGFSSLAYFCNVFKQKNGKTPLQYRANKN